MNTITDNPFGITREDVLNLAAQKLVDAYSGDPDLSETAERMIREKITEAFAHGIKRRIDDFLSEEMQRIVGQEIVPVNIWGEREGTPTTIKAELSKRAQQFWNVRVDSEGRESSYGGAPRSEVLMAKILKDEFSKAVKENAEVIIAGFKTAIKADATKLVADHIDKLINLKAR